MGGGGYAIISSCNETLDFHTMSKLCKPNCISLLLYMLISFLGGLFWAHRGSQLFKLRIVKCASNHAIWSVLVSNKKCERTKVHPTTSFFGCAWHVLTMKYHTDSYFASKNIVTNIVMCVCSCDFEEFWLLFHESPSIWWLNTWWKEQSACAQV